jgi:hypothetical protein
MTTHFRVYGALKSLGDSFRDSCGDPVAISGQAESPQPSPDWPLAEPQSPRTAACKSGNLAAAACTSGSKSAIS